MSTLQMSLPVSSLAGFDHVGGLMSAVVCEHLADNETPSRVCLARRRSDQGGSKGSNPPKRLSRHCDEPGVV